MSRHSLQGCLPSKVLINAGLNESLCEYLRNMPIHASDCSIAQCPPMAQTKAPTTKTWASFVRTKSAKIASGNRKSNVGGSRFDLNRIQCAPLLPGHRQKETYCSE